MAGAAHCGLYHTHTAAHMLSHQGSRDWAQSCVWSLSWQNEATSSMQLTWKLLIPKTPWCHQSGMNEPWPLTSLLETNKQTSKQQQQLHTKGPQDKISLSLFAVSGAVMKHQTAGNKTRYKGSTKHYCPENKKVLILSHNCHQAVSIGPFSVKTFHTQAKNNSLWIAYESLCGNFY